MKKKGTYKNGQVEKQVESVMSALDGLPVLEAGHDFYDRVRRRLSQEGSRRAPHVFALSGFPKLSPVFLILIVLLNLVTLYAALDGFRRMDDRGQNIEVLADRYFIDQARLLTDTDGR